MHRHPHFTVACACLAELLGTTPEIIRLESYDSDTDSGLAVQRQLQVLCNFADIMEQRGKDKR
jgi:hypothetical protein